MKEQIRENLRNLTGIIGITGAEQEVLKYLHDKFMPIADEVTISDIGNLVVTKKGSKPGPKLMLAVHADEVGFTIKAILNNGFICFEKIGFVADKILPGRKVWINTKRGRVPGVIGIKAAHLQTEEEKKKVQNSTELFLDVAASSREEVEKMGIRIGDRIAIQSDFMEMTNTDYICTKAVDDRVGCAVLLQLFKEIGYMDFAGTVCGVVTVQEEAGYTGAKVISHMVEPDYAIALDTIPCIDTPDCNPERQQPIWLNKGPVCAVDYGMYLGGATFNFIHPKVREMIEEASDKVGVPVQYLTCTESGYATDAPNLCSGYNGVPIGSLAIPRRYSHSPVEMMNLNDAIGSVKILKQIVQENGNKSLKFI